MSLRQSDPLTLLQRLQQIIQPYLSKLLLVVFVQDLPQVGLQVGLRRVDPSLGQGFNLEIDNVLVDGPVRDFLVPVLLCQKFGDLGHLDRIEGLIPSFLLGLLIDFLQNSLNLRDIGESGLLLIILFRSEFGNQRILDILGLIIDQSQNTGEHLLLSLLFKLFFGNLLSVHGL